MVSRAGQGLRSRRRGGTRRGAPAGLAPRFARVLVGLLLLGMAGAGSQGCGGRSGPAPATVPRVLVSVPPEAYMVRSIAGGRVDVEVLLPPGASPHTYEPSMGLARRAAAAELYLTVGHPRLTFETSWKEALSRSERTRVVALAAGCDSRADDPHLWLSAACADTMARSAESALRALLPARDSAGLRTGLDSTLVAMHRAEAVADSLLAPFRGRSFLVYHPAWGYFARDHGLREVAIQAGSREPGPRDLARVLSTVHEEGLRVLFIQPGMPRGEAARIASELGVRTELLDPLAEDWPGLIVRAARTLRRAWTS